MSSTRARAREPFEASPRGASSAGAAAGLVLGLVAAGRRGKPVHPAGVVHRGELTVHGAAHSPRGSTLLSLPARHPAVVRFSRSVGLPQRFRDLLGMSIRVLHCYGTGRHQDLLLVSSADLPVVHHFFLPAADFQERPYTSSLPYRAGSQRFLVGALPRRDSPRPDGADDLQRLCRAALTGSLSFDLAVSSLMGRMCAVAELRIGARLGPELDALRFNPWITGGGLRPAGWLNAMRRNAYPMSQAAWRRSRRDGSRAQLEAERRLDWLASDEDPA